MSLKRTRPTVVSTRDIGSLAGRARDDLALLELQRELVVDAELALGVGEEHLVHVRAHGHALLARVVVDGQVVDAQDDVLRRRDDRAAVRGREHVVRRQHERRGLDLRLVGERQVHGHLVAVEVGVEPRADEGVDADRVPLDEDRLERLDAHPVQRGRAVQEDGVLVDDLLEDVPHLLVLALEHLLRRLDRVGVAELLEAPDDEGLEQLERDLLRQAALVELQVRPDDDDGARAVVDALAEQVLAEPALLALDHVRQRLQRPVARPEHAPAAPRVVEQRVHRLLEHPLLVADDHLGGVQVEELLQPVVAVDEAAVEVVQVRRREVAAVEEDERAQVGRDDGDDVEDHPLRAVAGVAQRLDGAEALQDVLRLLLRARRREVGAELARELREVELREHLLDRLGPHRRAERVAVLLARLAVLLLREELALLERRVAGVDDDVVLEVDDALERARLHREQRPDAGRHRLEEPDVRDGRREVDVAHPLAAHPRVRHLHAAAVADDALVLDALVLAAEALPVALGPEDLLAEEPVLLGAVRAVVDRLGLLHLAVRPGPDRLGGREARLDGGVVVHPVEHGLDHRDSPGVPGT
jgi:hypothetical protein